MKRFLVRILVACLGLTLVNVCLYTHRKEDADQYLKDLNKEFWHKTFVFADSHGNCLKRDAATFGLNSLAYSSDSYKDIRLKLEYLLETGADIDTVILTVDPHTLSPYREVSNNYQYSSLLSDKLKTYFPIVNSQYTTTIPMLLERKIKSLIWNKESSDTKSTWADLSELEKDAAINRRLKSQFPSNELSSDLRNDLINIVDICKEEGIILYGIRFPLVYQYSTLVQEKDYGALKICINNGIPILDYQNISLADSFYSDQDHLNFSGGYELLKLIKRDLLNPTIISADGSY